MGGIFRVAVFCCAAMILTPFLVAEERTLDSARPPWSKEAESRLLKLIHETVVPRPRNLGTLPAEAEGLLAWSRPVDGLTVRIERVYDMPYGGVTIFVRMQNVSNRPLVVPTANPADPTKPSSFELHMQPYGKAWQRIRWSPGEVIEPGEPTREESRYAGIRSHRSTQASIVLQPKENCVIQMPTHAGANQGSKSIALASRIKVVVHPLDAVQADRWKGDVETPSYPRYPAKRLIDTLAYRTSFPDHFPQLTTRFDRESYLDDIENPVRQLAAANIDLIQLLDQYKFEGVRREFEKRMQAADQKGAKLKLLLASISASYGSEEAARYLVAAAHTTDGETVECFSECLSRVLFAFEDRDPPIWIVALIEAAIEANHCDSNLVYHLGQRKCVTAVPFLVDRAERGMGGYTWSALGMIGDQRAVPVLLNALKQGVANADFSRSDGPYEFVSPLGALAALKAREAVPFALAHLEYGDVIEDLSRFEDPQAIPKLRELISAKGHVLKDGNDLFPEQADSRRNKARRVLVLLEENDPLPKICELAESYSKGGSGLVPLIWELRRRQDLRSIPTLLRIVQTSPSGWDSNEAIDALGDHKDRLSVEALLQCYDANLDDKAYMANRGHAKDHIAKALRNITDQSIGPDKEQWATWWKAEGHLLKFN
jgi:hypothetical protein